MAVLSGDVKNKFDLLNGILDNAVNDWEEFHKPILTNFETTKRTINGIGCKKLIVDGWIKQATS